MGGDSGIPFGNYTLLRRVARGGMAEVFVARQKGIDGFDRLVAIKRILPHLLDDKSFVGMFQDEARLAARLSHPNIAHIYDFGKVKEHFFIAMEFMHGVHSGDLIRLAADKPMPMALAARIGADACAGLHYAHNRTDEQGSPLQLVHRDVSPPNLLISYDGVVKLVDFGIAKAVNTIEQTRPGMVKGKYAYMSPEQTMGLALNGRSDVFSLGLVLWELISGKPAVTRTDQILAMKTIRDGKVPTIREARQDVPEDLANALDGALQKDPAKRLDARAFGNLLEAFIKGSSDIATGMELGAWLTERIPPIGVLSKENDEDSADDPGDRRTSAEGKLLGGVLSSVREAQFLEADLVDALDMPRNLDGSRGSVVCALPSGHFSDAQDTRVLAASGNLSGAARLPQSESPGASIVIEGDLASASRAAFANEVLGTGEVNDLAELAALDYDDDDEPTSMVASPAYLASAPAAPHASIATPIAATTHAGASALGYQNNSQTVEDAPPAKRAASAMSVPRPDPEYNPSSPSPPTSGQHWPRQETYSCAPTRKRAPWIAAFAAIVMVVGLASALLGRGEDAPGLAEIPDAQEQVTSTQREISSPTIVVTPLLLDAGLAPVSDGAVTAALPLPDNSPAPIPHKHLRKKRKGTRRSGLLEITSTPSATVFLRGRRIGSTPITNFPMDGGRYALILKAQKYKSTRKIAVIRPGKITKLTIALRPL